MRNRVCPRVELILKIIIIFLIIFLGFIKSKPCYSQTIKVKKNSPCMGFELVSLHSAARRLTTKPPSWLGFQFSCISGRIATCGRLWFFFSRIQKFQAELRRELVTGYAFRRYGQFETSPEAMEQELRPAVCERRQI